MKKQKTDLDRYYFYDFLASGWFFLTALMLGLFIYTKSFNFGMFTIFDFCLCFVFASRSDFYHKKCYQLREDLIDEKKDN